MNFMEEGISLSIGPSPNEATLAALTRVKNHTTIAKVRKLFSIYLNFLNWKYYCDLFSQVSEEKKLKILNKISTDKISMEEEHTRVVMMGGIGKVMM